jgi:hypothetical protein
MATLTLKHNIGPTSDAPCEYCGRMHNSLCPRIQEIEYEFGIPKRVKFWPSSDVGLALGTVPRPDEMVFVVNPAFTDEQRKQVKNIVIDVLALVMNTDGKRHV